MRLSLFAAALLAAAALAAPPAAAQEFRARNGLTVVPEGARDFTVRYRAARSDHAYWCAAGQYVQRRLGLNGAERIYLLSDLPRKRGEGLRFSLDAGGARDPGFSSFSGGEPELGVSAVFARGLCTTLPRPGDND